jgi:hypothetical protein
MFNYELIWVKLKDLIKCKDVIILLMGQINFIKELIREKISLESQFELNWEDWSFKGPNLIFTKSIDWN